MLLREICASRDVRARPARVLWPPLADAADGVVAKERLVGTVFVGEPYSWARTDPNEQESVVMRPDLDARVP